MKKVLLTVLMLVVTIISAVAQKVDFTTYEVVANAGDVSVIVKDNDYRMVVGSLKKPKLNMVMGYTKEQAASKMDRILDFSKGSYIKKGRIVSVCGVMFRLNINGEGADEKFHFAVVNQKVKFELSQKDCVYLKQSLIDDKQ